MTRDELVAAIRRDFSPTSAARLLRLVRDGVRLRATPVPWRPEMSRSRFGGLPDLPEDFDWPGDDEYLPQPMCFVAQLDLADFAGLPGTELLPRQGLLSFFADHADLSGCGPETFCVRYFPDPPERLLPTEPTVYAFSRDDMWNVAVLEPFELRIEPAAGLPPSRWSRWIVALGLSEDERDRFGDLSRRLCDDHDEPYHAMLLWPSGVQRDPAEDLYSHAWSGEERVALERWDLPVEQRQGVHDAWLRDYGARHDGRSPPGEADHCRLLLQVDFAARHPGASADSLWGLGTSAYFMIAEAELAKGNFLATELLVQGT